MSVYYDTGNVKNFCDVDHEVGNAIIELLALCLGIPSITEKNKEEVLFRIQLHENMLGARRYRMCVGGKVPQLLTKKDIDAWIGLTTNGDKHPRAEFIRTLFEAWQRNQK